MAERSKLRQLCDEGGFAAFYTQKGYFVKVKPVYQIDKVKFCFVEKGKKGSGFDIYVDTDEFDLLCDDILSERMAKQIQKENSEYPSAWKYVTGEKGNKSVAIGKSKNGGVVIHGAVIGEKKMNAFVPCTYNDLRKMAKNYQRFSQGYWNEICDEFRKGYADTQKYFKGVAEDDEISVEAPVEVPTEKPAEKPIQKKVNFAKFSAFQALPFQKSDGYGVKVVKDGVGYVMSISGADMTDRVKLLIEKIDQVHAKGGSVGFTCEYTEMKDGNLKFIKLAS